MASIVKTPFPKSRKLSQPDGTIGYSWDGKLHNWEGPALIPQGNMRKKKYFLYGFEKTKDEWQEMRSQREGLPWYKQAAPKGTTHRN